jgi:hypothetical protein
MATSKMRANIGQSLGIDKIIALNINAGISVTPT